MKQLIALSLVLVLTHCASAPKPSHCKNDGKGLKPLNTTPVKLSAKEHHD